MIDEFVIPEPSDTDYMVTTQDLVSGAPIPPLDRLKTLNPDAWEDLTLELVSHWKTNYKNVVRCGGAGDLGRDVIAYSDEANPAWENYQCKFYAGKLKLATALEEIGKTIYFAYAQYFTMPSRYYFVAPQGVSAQLLSHLMNPEQLKSNLVDRWESVCKKKITKTKDIELDDELKSFIDNVDFSIFTHIPPIKIIELHSKTPYHNIRFGGKTPQRALPELPPTEIATSEFKYTTELLRAFTEAESENVEHSNLGEYEEYSDEFNRARKNYYSAENLEKFSRDWLPLNSYELLLDECYESILPTVRRNNSDGYQRYLSTNEQVVQVSFSSHPLVQYIKAQDRKGMCHQLVNRNKIVWINGSK